MGNSVFALIAVLAGFGLQGVSHASDDLTLCWSEGSSKTIDGTFVVEFDFRTIANGADRVSYELAAYSMMHSSENLNLLGKPMSAELHPELDVVLLQANFANLAHETREELKAGVAQDLAALSKAVPALRSISCLDQPDHHKGPTIPSVSGSN